MLSTILFNVVTLDSCSTRLFNDVDTYCINNIGRLALFNPGFPSLEQVIERLLIKQLFFNTSLDLLDEVMNLYSNKVS